MNVSTSQLDSINVFLTFMLIMGKNKGIHLENVHYIKLKVFLNKTDATSISLE